MQCLSAIDASWLIKKEANKKWERKIQDIFNIINIKFDKL